MLADAGVKAIFATEFHRTQDTGKPLAAKLGIEVQSIPANDTAALVARVKASHREGRRADHWPLEHRARRHQGAWRAGRSRCETMSTTRSTC